MTKYRIRLNGGRVIGPFLQEQLNELKAKGHISGNEEAQVFPTGSWGPIAGFDFYKEMMEGNVIDQAAEPLKEDTFFIDLTNFRKQTAEKEIEQQLKTSESPAIEPLTETHIKSAGPENVEVELDATDHMPASEIKLELDLSDRTVTATATPIIPTPDSTKSKDLKNFELQLDKAVDEDAGDKTNINPLAQKELAKLRQRMIAEEEVKKEEEAKKAEAEVRRKEADALALQLREEEKDESTQMIKLDSFSKDLMVVANEEEVIIEKVAKDIKKKKAAQEAAEAAENEEEGDNEDEEAAKAKKKKIIIVGLVLLLGYAFLFPEKKAEKPPFKVIQPEIEFPLPFDVKDPKASAINFQQGREHFAKGGYINLIKAGTLFRKSFENDMDNVAALNLLVRTYAEELRFSKNKQVDAHTLFNIIQSKRPQLIRDPNGAIGLNLFYMSINKFDAAVDVTAKYFKLNSTNNTPDLFAAYLKSLMKVGKLELAAKVFKGLEKSPEKNRYAYDALIEFHMLNQEFAKAEEYADDAMKRNPELVSFILIKTELLLKNKKFKEMEPLLKKANDLNLEYNDVYRAKFLELRGLFLASSGKVELATKVLTESLKLEDSNELRMRLADLSDTNGTLGDTDKLISESKALRLLNQAREFYDKKSFELALSTAARASDAHPGHIPSDLFLAKVQLRLGLAEQAIKTLEALLRANKDSKEINFAMLETYIDTYKFNDAKDTVAKISQLPELKNTWEFASLNAKLYGKMGDTLQTVSWLKASMNMNPLNDRDIFHLAETFIKRGKFDPAQILLNKCMELDPVNPDYRIAYSKLIYERQDDTAAIGYLLNLLEEFGENPKFLSEIAIFYFRSGKVKDFLAYKEKLQKLPNKDKALYEFLIKAALLDERYDDIPGLVEQLIAIEPGDLESMMTAGRVLFEHGKLVEAAAWFKRVRAKLSTYPKVQYYVAKIQMLGDEIDDPVDKETNQPILDENGKPKLGAKNLILKDIKENGESDITLVLMAEIHGKKGELTEAENYYKKAQKMNPKSYDAMVGMADISTKRNNFDIALDLYKRAMDQKSDEAVLHRKVGDVYRLLGQGSLAMESYKMYLEMDPDAADKGTVQNYINMMQ
ncbi:MAG TPA: tetratricopeptide repeat protein [Bacteriovoracaceae bacterium]|nr:tetratricopeptide repeat protein [Bacteriovoracaceae bacterium]